ncbi:Nramp family divalent metal transporter [Reyranella sp.]|uniref:Nramp family divalent metal transporter n=1 Tax=Reyranella sp. TaxID=1929291 RepID=UPI002718C454|nr:Nramp family divalent metal transporter [Reyranella sp.]MDO8972540.1 Nramp family divalent metal transporter [Reyranella sp.]
MVATSTQGLIKRLGPGVITGAADDDPSGIATYSQAGAHAGFGLLWTVVLTWPLMVAVQSVSARIGRVTGHGLAANMCRAFPRPVVLGAVLLLFVANTINIGADLAAMGAAVAMLVGGGQVFFSFLFAIASVLAIVFIPYSRYVGFLKYLTFSLFAYVGVVFTAHIDWRAVGIGALVPKFALDKDTLMLVVAVLGTTISPYLFFWQSSQEVEDEEGDAEAGPLTENPEQAPRELRRIGWETGIGMAVSNLVAFFIILTTAATLHANGKTDIESTQQAAEALRPIAGDAAFLLFSLGIIGTGLLAVPVLAGSAAYALGEVRGWRIGLEHEFGEARRFYITIAVAILAGLGVALLPIDPIKALIWSAVLNGVIVVPIIGAMMIVASRREIMGDFTASVWQRVLGWLTLVLMAAAAIGMFVLM